MTMLAPTKVFAIPPHQVLESYEIFTGLSPEALAGPEKTQSITRSRHEAMWILRQLTTMSLAAIGQMFGGRDMASVQAGVGNVADRMAREPEYRDAIRVLLAKISDWKTEPAQPLHSDIRLAAARGILADHALSDADARNAALHMLGDSHGA